MFENLATPLTRVILVPFRPRCSVPILELLLVGCAVFLPMGCCVAFSFFRCVLWFVRMWWDRTSNLAMPFFLKIWQFCRDGFLLMSFFDEVLIDWELCGKWTWWGCCFRCYGFEYAWDLIVIESAFLLTVISLTRIVFRTAILNKEWCVIPVYLIFKCPFSFYQAWTASWLIRGCGISFEPIRHLSSFRFYHAYDNYMTHAFPVSCCSFPIFGDRGTAIWAFCWMMLLFFSQHDELKPLTKTFTDSLSELGNLKVITDWLCNWGINQFQMLGDNSSSRCFLFSLSTYHKTTMDPPLRW